MEQNLSELFGWSWEGLCIVLSAAMASSNVSISVEISDHPQSWEYEEGPSHPAKAGWLIKGVIRSDPFFEQSV